ncbi:hypothetical protein BKA62DRAFT_332421 [Auriculariales sp. MPI-PUGE-AT-0066]|nr:hypothetical protein BKA62DRAFT_332421 [Auriculariales sp. MPI-PUGE-AT-0066]
MEHRDYNVILGIIRPVMKTIPGIGNILEGSVETLIAISTQVQTARANQQELADLLEHTIAVETQVTNALHKTRDGSHQALKKSVERFVGVLIEVKRLVEYLQTNNPGKREAAMRKIGRYFQAYSTAGRIAAMKQRISDTATVFGLAAHVRTEQRVLEMLQLCREMADEVLGKRLDDILKPAHEAAHYAATAPRACTVGTRVGILSTIHAWAESDGGPIVYWLAGLAGTGKTTIARSICDLLVAADVKVLSFFISRNAAARNTLGAVITTLAHQLAQASPVAMMKISAAVKQQPPISFLPIADQTKALLVDPLSAMWSFPAAAPQRMIIVIDALDECEDFARFGGHDLLATLIPVLSRPERDVKLFLTSRYEQDIRLTLDRVFATAKNERETFLLHEVDEASVSADIRTFIDGGFADIRLFHSTIPSAWPPQEDVDELVSLSGKLFVYASTVLTWIGDRRDSPISRLIRILHAARLSQPVGAHEQSPHKALDTLYLVILGNATSEEDPKSERNSRLRQLSFLVTCAGYDVSSQVLAGILMLEQYELWQMLESLSAVLQLPTNMPRDFDVDISHHAESNIDIPLEMRVRAFHKSFPDFLVDPRRCSDTRFFISRAYEEAKLALATLEAANMLPMTQGINVPFVLDQLANKPPLLPYINLAWSHHVRSVLVNPDVDLRLALSLIQSLQKRGAVELLDHLRVPSEHLRHIHRLLATLVDTLPEASRLGFREQLMLLEQASSTTDVASPRTRRLLLLAHAVTAIALAHSVPGMVSAQNDSSLTEPEVEGEGAYLRRLQELRYIMGCDSIHETEHFDEELRNDVCSYIGEIPLSEKALVLKLIEICVEVRVRFQALPSVPWLQGSVATILPMSHNVRRGQELPSSSTDIRVLVHRGSGGIYARWSGIPYYWPSRNQREELVHMLERMPKSTSLVLSWIDDSRASPVARLTELLVAAKRSPQTVLDPIYRQILDNASKDLDLSARGNLELRQLLHVMVFSGDDAYLEIVRGVLNFEFLKLEPFIDSLSALLESPKDKTPPATLGRRIHILSEAFADFVVDPKRCTDERFLVSHEREESKLATLMLKCVERRARRRKSQMLEAGTQAFEEHIRIRWCIPLLNNLLNPELDVREVSRLISDNTISNDKIGYVQVTAVHLRAVHVLLAAIVDNSPENALEASRQDLLISARLATSNALSVYHELVFVIHAMMAIVLYLGRPYMSGRFGYETKEFQALQGNIHRRVDSIYLCIV